VHGKALVGRSREHRVVGLAGVAGLSTPPDTLARIVARDAVSGQ